MIDTIIQRKSCLHCQNSFDITDHDMEFYNKISPTFAGQKFQIPTPTLCPECRQRRRLSFRNERNLYKRKCDASGKDIICIYSPDKPYKVYDQKIRRSDARDPMEYGRDFDFRKSFTDNFKLLSLEVPLPNLLGSGNENSDYVNYTANSRNCYLTTTTAFSENLLYVASGWYSKNSIDCLDIVKSENCYDSIGCLDCNQCISSRNCSNCSNISYCDGCVGCSFCYGCVDLQNESYCIENKKYSKEEYMKEILIQSKPSRKPFSSKYQNCMSCENVVGTYLKESKNSKQSHFCNKIIDSSFCLNVSDVNDCYDCSCFGFQSYLSYEIITGEELRTSLINFACIDGDGLLYNSHCFHGKNLFGCIGLRNKSYCIFNKQYTKEEYEKTVANIITHMIETKERGEFFHPSLSPFGYNETVAQEYFPVIQTPSPITSEYPPYQGEKASMLSGDLKNNFYLPDKGGEPLAVEGLKKFGYSRSHYQAPSPVADKVIDGKNLPDTIDEVSDDILKSAIKCEVTGKLFRIIPQELAFYRKHHIPLPRRHPDQRHKERMELRK